jgi:hypothetical protein
MDSVPKRDYILDLADPSRLPKRPQKQSATFQCDLCPKRFTRAYNLRSHMRTHTGKRPLESSVPSHNTNGVDMYELNNVQPQLAQQMQQAHAQSQAHIEQQQPKQDYEAWYPYRLRTHSSDLPPPAQGPLLGQPELHLPQKESQTHMPATNPEEWSTSLQEAHQRANAAAHNIFVR